MKMLFFLYRPLMPK